MMNNKRGFMTIFMVIILAGLLLFLILLFIGGVVVVRINNALDQDIEMGSVNLQDLNDDTFGKFTLSYINNADWWGMAVIFGMVAGLFLSSYFMRGKFPKFGIIFDILIIVTMFIVSLYISATYSTMLEAFSEAGETFLEDYAPHTSNFMINLPIYIVIIGVIMMFLFHSSIPRKEEERQIDGGYLQGI